MFELSVEEMHKALDEAMDEREVQRKDEAANELRVEFAKIMLPEVLTSVAQIEERSWWTTEEHVRCVCETLYTYADALVQYHLNNPLEGSSE